MTELPDYKMEIAPYLIKSKFKQSCDKCEVILD